jgi:Ca2+/Na+ antiporter
MGTVLSALGLVLSLVLLWTGRKHMAFGSYVNTVLSVVEVLALVIAIVSLGWWGVAIVAMVNVVAFLVWSVVLFAQVEERLTYAAIQAGESKETMLALARRLRNQSEFAAFGPIKRADLIKLLSERGRSVEETEAMAAPIALLEVVHKPPLDWLVDHFDRLLRLVGEPASESMRIADIITASTQKSAATFVETVEALVAVYE